MKAKRRFAAFVCAICKKKIKGQWGNNPAPFAGDKCCDSCNDTKVVPARIEAHYRKA